MREAMMFDRLADKLCEQSPMNVGTILFSAGFIIVICGFCYLAYITLSALIQAMQ